MANPSIRSVKARVVYNSRGEEALEVEVNVEGSVGRASSPSGASVGRHEATAFAPGGARATVKLVNEYSSKLIGLDASDIYSLNGLLRQIDGTGSYSRIGSSAAYSITFAVAEAASKAQGVPLFRLLKGEGPYSIPYPLGNVLGGGRHAGGGAPEIQEFLAFPAGAGSIQEALSANVEVHKEVRRRIEAKDPYFTAGRGDEGAWVPNLSNEEALEVTSSAIEAVSASMGFPIRLGVDFAASELWREKEGVYVYRREGKRLSPEEQMNFVLEAVDRHGLFYVEDPFHDEAVRDFSGLTKALKGAYVAGDDLFATNCGLLAGAAMEGAGNAAVLKVNQAGGLGDAIEFVKVAKKHGYALVTSHRSGESIDAHIAHLAVASGSKMIKTGVVGGERVAKLNELIRISELPFIEGMARLDI